MLISPVWGTNLIAFFLSLAYILAYVLSPFAIVSAFTSKDRKTNLKLISGSFLICLLSFAPFRFFFLQWKSNEVLRYNLPPYEELFPYGLALYLFPFVVSLLIAITNAGKHFLMKSY